MIYRNLQPRTATGRTRFQWAGTKLECERNINSSPTSAAYMRQWIGSALVQIMACRLFGAKPLSKPMLGYCQLDSQEQTSWKCIWNIVCEMTVILSRERWVKGEFDQYKPQLRVIWIPGLLFTLGMGHDYWRSPLGILYGHPTIFFKSLLLNWRSGSGRSIGKWRVRALHRDAILMEYSPLTAIEFSGNNICFQIE